MKTTLRTTRWLPLIACAALALTGCARSSVVPSADDAGPRIDATVAELCDGSPSIRFGYYAVTVEALWGPTPFQYENGAAFLIISGTCDYWVFNPPGVVRKVTADVRGGRLTPEQARSIAGRLRFGALEALAGDYRRLPDLDVGYDEYIVDISGTVICNNILCHHGDAIGQPAVRALYVAVSDIAIDLHETGAPLTGDISYSVSPVRDLGAAWPDGWPYGWVEWPFATPLQTGRGRMAALDAATLRDLRARQRDNREWCPSCASVPFRDGDGPIFELVMRDSLPFEDADGHIQLPYGVAGP